jgi:hypothetical protein
MLSVIWRSLDPIEKVIFPDGTEQYFFPRLKLEKTGIGQYELLKTTTDIYRPVEDYMVEFAYDNSIRALSDSIVYSYHSDRLLRNDAEGTSMSDKALAQLKEKVKAITTKTTIHLNQIKEDYGKPEKTIQASGRQLP